MAKAKSPDEILAQQMWSGGGGRKVHQPHSVGHRHLIDRLPPGFRHQICQVKKPRTKTRPEPLQAFTIETICRAVSNQRRESPKATLNATMMHYVGMSWIVTFSDCKGNDKLRYEVSSPYFKVNSDGGLVSLRNITAVGKTLFVHARTPHAEDMAELVIVGGKDIQGSLQCLYPSVVQGPGLRDQALVQEETEGPLLCQTP
ncbi:Cadherin-13 [Fukomys damarensis]|uniref:Cadherin-13 n=1 Tax=Fukomys damarensis TaxID=885580 RepID=A0A091DZQ5_FUKDA|nr:Cadherin-13 [Fukomys damarensis]